MEELSKGEGGKREMEEIAGGAMEEMSKRDVGRWKR